MVGTVVMGMQSMQCDSRLWFCFLQELGIDITVWEADTMVVLLADMYVCV